MQDSEHCTTATKTQASWQEQLAGAIRSPQELLARVGIETDIPVCNTDNLRHFPLLVPHAFAGRIRVGDASDPLLRQVFPDAAEDQPAPGFVRDPLGECSLGTSNGLMQKYPGRALLLTTAACAIHCRYCFRRHFPYQEQGFTRSQRRQLLAALTRDNSVREVILSGGDPLTLADAPLRELCVALAAIPHIRRLRIHTRLPIVLPDRVNEALLETLAALEVQTVLVVHSNHANEIDEAVARGLLRLHECGVRLFNQSVLLAGVNDNAESLAALSERLFDCRVVPYYLHLLDPVAGAAHYQVSTHRAREIMQQLRTQLPGYLVPRSVREQAGENYKLPVL